MDRESIDYWLSQEPGTGLPQVDAAELRNRMSYAEILADTARIKRIKEEFVSDAAVGWNDSLIGAPL